MDMAMVTMDIMARDLLMLSQLPLLSQDMDMVMDMAMDILATDMGVMDTMDIMARACCFTCPLGYGCCRARIWILWSRIWSWIWLWTYWLRIWWLWTIWILWSRIWSWIWLWTWIWSPWILWQEIC